MLALAMMLATPAAQAQDLSIPYETYTLDNGLKVIFSEDHSVPVVQVNVWYHVGSKDEVEGRTGFAHLFEHLMFQGSENNDQDYFGNLQEVGARVNGTTNGDRTNYFEGVPSAYLPLALWGEADRMGFLVIDQERLDNQKEVVRNERRQRYENRPFGTSWVTLQANLFPVGHPYHHTTIGSHEDLDAATLDDVQSFYDQWYVPNNAVLVVAGDFDPATAKALIEQYFGTIPASAEPLPERVVPDTHNFEMTEEVVIRQEEQGVPYSQVWMAWPSPAIYESGDADLDLLSSLLTDGKDSRLYGKLVIEDQIAKSISAYQVSRYLDGMYIIQAVPAEGHTTDELVAATDALLAEFMEEGPTETEVSVGKVQYEAAFIYGLSTVSAKADRLNSYNFMAGEPDYLQSDLQRYLDCTPESVLQASKDTFGSPGRVVLHISPPAEAAQ
jgi:predicted Zn-dependent peptidase